MDAERRVSGSARPGDAHDGRLTMARARLARAGAARLRHARRDARAPGGHVPRPAGAPARARRAACLRPPASSTPTASTARTSRYLTGFDPRFEEAILVVGTDRRAGHPRGQRVLRHGRRRAAADAPASSSRTSACRASRATARGRWRRSWPTRASRAGARVGVLGWKTYADTGDHRGARLHRRRAAPPRRRRAGWSRTPTTCSSTPPTGCASSTRSTSSPPRVGRLPDLATASATLVRGLRPGMTEQEAVAPAGLERDAALLPPDAHRRAARHARPAQPRRPAASSAETASPSPSASGAR